MMNYTDNLNDQNQEQHLHGSWGGHAKASLAVDAKTDANHPYQFFFGPMRWCKREPIRNAGLYSFSQRPARD